VRTTTSSPRYSSSSSSVGKDSNPTGVYAPDTPKNDPSSPPAHASHPFAAPSKPKYTQATEQADAAQQGRPLASGFASESLDQLYAKRASTDATPFEDSSSTSPNPPHPVTTDKVPHTGADAVGSSSSVRYRSAPGDMAQGSNYGVGLQDESSVTRNKESKLADVNQGPSEEQGKKGLEHAWKDRK